MTRSRASQRVRTREALPDSHGAELVRTVLVPERRATQAPFRAKGFSQSASTPLPSSASSQHETEMERTDDRLVGGCDLFEGAAPKHSLCSVRGSLQLGSETELFMQANELVNRVLLGDRRERGRPTDEVRPKPVQSARRQHWGRALTRQAGDSLRKRPRRASRRRPRRERAAGPDVCAVRGASSPPPATPGLEPRF